MELKWNLDMNWHEFFMRNAYLYASKSKDESTRIGAVIVKNKTIISGGYNGICRGVDDKKECRHVRPEKYHWFEHAERNAIYNAARIGVSTIRATLYTNGIPCTDCARGIIQAGIRRIVVHAPWCYKWGYIQSGNPEWCGDLERTMMMCNESGVEAEYFNENLGLLARIGGKDFEL